MAIRFGDRVYDTTETTGQGPFTLSDVAVPTFQRPSTFFANGDRFIGYLGHAPNAGDPPPNEWIVALFEYSSTGPAVSVVEIYDGSSGTSAVSFSSGVKQVYSAPNAGRPGVKVSDGKDADARPTNPVVNDLYVITDTGAVQRYDGSSWVTIATSNTGTVTSVGLTMPSIFSVASSPITSSGTLAVTLASQTKAMFWASPTVENGAPVFRVIAAGDLPSTVAYQNAKNTFTEDQTFDEQVTFKGTTLFRVYDLTEGIYHPVKAATNGIDFTEVPNVFFEAVYSEYASLGIIEGDGSALSFLNASAITSGTLSADRLATSGVTAATYGSATASFVAAVDKYGRITTAESKTITPSWGNLVSVPANVDAFGNLVSVASRIPYFTGYGTMDMLAFSAVGQNLLNVSTPGETSWITVSDKGAAALRTAKQTVASLVTIVPDGNTSITLSDATHNGVILETTSDSPVTITVPAGLPAGFNCAVCQVGAGTVKYVQDSSTIRPANNVEHAGQWSMTTVYHRGGNEIVIAGGLAP